MKEESIKILDVIDKDSLIMVKLEAELLMDEITNSENITISKANNYFQILFAVTISLIGFLVSRNILVNEIDLSYYICLILVFYFFIALFFFSKILYPKTEGLKGALPTDLLQNDIFNKSEHEYEQLLANRIMSLDNCLIARKVNQNQRIKDFKCAVSLILCALVTVVLFVLVYFFCILS
jgi:hypothetical protein